MRRALVLMDPSDAGIGALEAARRVAATAAPEVTVVSIGSEAAQSGALAVAGARHLERTAGAQVASSGLGIAPRLGTVESISLTGDPARTAAALLAATRADLVIVGQSVARERCPIVTACLGSQASAILIAMPGARRQDHAYRHVAAAGWSPHEALPVAQQLAADEALLSATFLVDPGAPVGSIAEAHAAALELQRHHDLDAAIVEGEADDLGTWLVDHGVEVVAVPSPPAASVEELDEIAGHLLALRQPDLLLVRPISAAPPRGRRRATRAKDALRPADWLAVR
jgi:hypothetical protein